MKKLQYRLTNYILCKMLFVKYPELLKKASCRASKYRIYKYRAINIRNPEMPPESIDDKFCRLDINMMVEEDLAKIERLELPITSEAIKAYRHVSASSVFKEKERLWAKARYDEAQALKNARNQGAEKEREKWQDVVAEKDAENAELRI